MRKEKWMHFAILLIMIISATCAYCCASIDGFLMDEATVIVWDKKSHTEHFIRRATFDNIKGRSVGFIVPTPTVPQLAEANEDVFLDLDRMMEPETETQNLRDISLNSWLFPSWNFSLFQEPEPMPNVAATAGAPPADAAEAPMPDVEVLQHQQIGDLDAITVRATDAKALNRWLAKHDYSSSPEFEKWLDVYVQKGWVVTAFKFARPRNASELSSPLIRMSFTTDQPFYPYREPQSKNAPDGRELRIYLFANERMQAASGQFGQNKNWPGEVEWSDDLQKHSTRLKNFDPSLAKQLGLPEATMQQAHWMTVFDDYSSSRRGSDDVTFIPTTNESKVPNPIVEYKRTETKVPVEAVLLLVVIVGVFIKTRHRNGKSTF